MYSGICEIYVNCYACNCTWDFCLPPTWRPTWAVGCRSALLLLLYGMYIRSIWLKTMLWTSKNNRWQGNCMMKSLVFWPPALILCRAVFPINCSWAQKEKSGIVKTHSKHWSLKHITQGHSLFHKHWHKLLMKITWGEIRLKPVQQIQTLGKSLITHLL